MFLVMCLTEVVLLILFLAHEKIGFSFLSFLCFSVLLHFGITGYQVDLIHLVLSDVPRALSWFFGYLFVGAVYSIFRWYFRVPKIAKKMAVVKTKLDDAQLKLAEAKISREKSYDEGHPQVFRDASLQLERTSATELRLRDDMKDLRRGLYPSLHKTLITGWIAFFPIDAISLFFEEPVQRIFRFLAGTYTRISKDALKKYGLSEEADKIDEFHL
jgi:hypothetical protein